MNRLFLLRLMIPVLLFAVSAVSHGAKNSPSAERITALNIGAPSPTLCNGNPVINSTGRDVLPGAWRNPARYGTGWDLHRDAETGLMSVTWYTFDAARRPVWYRSAIAQIDPMTQTWRSSIENARLERGVPVEPAPIGAIAVRFIQENPGKIAIRWSLDGQNGPPSDECLIDAFDESRNNGAGRARRWKNHSFNDLELVRTPIQHNGWSGDRLVVLGFDSSGAPVWTVGISPNANASQIPLSYFYSNYPGGSPSTSCAHQGCVSAPRPAGRLIQVPGNAAIDIALGLNSAEVGQTVQLNRSGDVQALSGTQTSATAFNSINVSPAGNCTLAPGVTSCQKTVSWYISTAGARAVRVRTDTNPIQVFVIGTSASGNTIQMLTAGRWKFEIRRNDAMQSTIVSTAEIVVGNGTSGTPTNTIGFRPVLECRNSSVGVSPGTTPGISGRWWNSQRYSTGWDLVFTEPTAQYPNGTLIATWNTFGRNAEPVWLMAPTMQIEVATESGQTVKRAWGQLNRYTWHSGTNVATATPVGEVAFTFDPTDATRASLRWKWSEAIALPLFNECVSEYSRAVSNTATLKNQAFTGSWYEPQLPGYGYSVYMASGAGTSVAETQVLNAYDIDGQPRWVIGATAGPTANWTDVPLSYLRSNFPGGVPTSDCPDDQCRTTYPANKLARMFSGDGATGSTQVEAYYTGFGITLAWYRSDTNPRYPVSIAKIARTDEIVVNRQLCTITTAACQVLVSWTSTRAEARAYRVDLATGTWTLLDPQSAVGTRTESFSNGGRFRYVLTVPETPAMQTIASSAEVVISGQLPGTTSQISINQSSCTLGTTACTVVVNWSTDVNTTARVYRRRMDGTGDTYRIPVNSASGQHTDTLTVAGRYRYELKEVDAATAANLAVSGEIVISAAVPQPSNCTFGGWATAGTPIAGEPDDLIPVPRYRGRCAIQVDTVGDYLIDNSPENEDKYNARFYYFTGDRSGGNADIFQALGATAEIIRVQHDGINLRFIVSGSASFRAVPVTANRWYAITLNWTAGAGNGELRIAVVSLGSPVAGTPTSITNIYNSIERIDSVRLGLITGAGSGKAGFDEFEARRHTTPALRCRGDANDDDVISSSDRTRINLEINAGGDPTSPGQPDANENGVVDSADITEVTNLLLAGHVCPGANP